VIDPLENIGQFNHHTGTVLSLSDVTTLTIEDRSTHEVLDRLGRITRWHRRFLKPAREVILSTTWPSINGVEWIKIKPWQGNLIEAYSNWCHKELKNYFDTKFVMVWHSDGFALDPSCWSDDFLKYDYIGSPFFFDSSIVGNGGFSLRSKAFCEEGAKIINLNEAPEDRLLCIYNRTKLESKGIKFAPVELANQWGTEFDSLEGRFGFHGKKMMRKVAGYMGRFNRSNAIQCL
jgi:hypothetical protein